MFGASEREAQDDVGQAGAAQPEEDDSIGQTLSDAENSFPMRCAALDAIGIQKILHPPKKLKHLAGCWWFGAHAAGIYRSLATARMPCFECQCAFGRASRP